MKRLFALVVAGGLLATMTVLAIGQARIGQPPLNCDRACLTKIADSYFAALVAHDPSRAAMAPNAKFTENTQVLPLTEGLWKNATQAPTSFKIVVPDPVSGQLTFVAIRGLEEELTSQLASVDGLRGGCSAVPD